MLRKVKDTEVWLESLLMMLALLRFQSLKGMLLRLPSVSIVLFLSFCRIWSSGFRSWVLEAVLSAGSGLSSVHARCSTSVDFEEYVAKEGGYVCFARPGLWRMLFRPSTQDSGSRPPLQASGVWTLKGHPRVAAAPNKVACQARSPSGLVATVPAVHLVSSVVDILTKSPLTASDCEASPTA